MKTYTLPFRPARCLAAMALLALAAPGIAAAPSVTDMASMSLDRLLDLQVSVASRAPQRLSEAAGSVTVITAAEMRALGHQTIADALRTVRGLMVAYDRSYHYLGVRGFYAPGDFNTRVLLLVDGNRVNDNVYDQAYIGTDAPLDLDQVERIEFIPGQGSAVYGANALFGVVNVVTRAPQQAGSGATLLLGSGRTRELRGTLQGEVGRWSWLVAASRRVSAGVDPVVPEAEAAGFAGGVVPGTDHEQVNRLRVAVAGAGWRASLLHSDRSKGIGAPVDAVFGDRRSANRDAQTLADVSTGAALSPNLDWQARAFAGRYRYHGDFALDYPPLTLNRDDDEGRWWGVEARLDSRAWAGHAIQVGVELQRSTRISLRNFDLDQDRTVYLDHRGSSHRFGIHAEDRIEWGSGWSTTLGLRLDRVDGHDAQLNPRLAVIRRFGDAWVFKAVHGSAFRPPNAFERDYASSGPGGYERNPALGGERVRGQELIAEWTPRRDWRFTFSGYRTRANELIVLESITGTETFTFRNHGQLRLRGLEAELQWQGPRGLALRANLALQRSGGEGAGMGFSELSPRRMGKATLIAPLTGSWTLGLDGVAQSRRGAAAGSAIVNATLAGDLGWRGARLALTLANLFDRHWADPGGAPDRQPLVVQDGRSWRLQLSMAH